MQDKLIKLKDSFEAKDLFTEVFLNQFWPRMASSYIAINSQGVSKDVTAILQPHTFANQDYDSVIKN